MICGSPVFVGGWTVKQCIRRADSLAARCTSADKGGRNPNGKVPGLGWSAWSYRSSRFVSESCLDIPRRHLRTYKVQDETGHNAWEQVRVDD